MSNAATPAPGAEAEPKLAIYWAASCAAPEYFILGIDDKILDLADAFELVLCPCVSDGKVRDIEQMEDGENRRVPVQQRHP